MDDEWIVEEGRSWRGLHHVHVMRMGIEVDLERWIQKVLDLGGEVQAFYSYQEEELGVWHMRLYWKVPGEALPEVRVTPVEIKCQEPGVKFHADKEW